jgi:hypothetical protein
MNKSKIIWGIICLAIAALLGVLNLTLEPDRLMFTVGDNNLPWVPALVLGVIGIALLATARGVKQSSLAERELTQTPADPEKVALNKRMENIGWGLFLIMLGGFMFIPQETIPKGLWSIGLGLIFLGLNLARYLNGIRMSGFTTALGILSLVSGGLELAGWTNLEGGILIIILGIYLLFKPYFDKRELFGKAEVS